MKLWVYGHVGDLFDEVMIPELLHEIRPEKPKLQVYMLSFPNFLSAFYSEGQTIVTK